MEILIKILFLLSFCLFICLWLIGVISQVMIFKLAKIEEHDFFKKYILKDVGSIPEFFQFWRLMRQGKESTLTNKRLREKIKLLQLVKKIFFVVFGITCLLLFYIWAH